MPRHRRHTVDKFGLEEDICVVEHAVLQRDHDELDGGESGIRRKACIK